MMTRTFRTAVAAAFIAGGAIAGTAFIAGATMRAADESATACDLCAATGARVDALTDEAAYARADAACAFAYDVADAPFKAAHARADACHSAAYDEFARAIHADDDSEAAYDRRRAAVNGAVDVACDAADAGLEALYATEITLAGSKARSRERGLSGCRRDPGPLDRPASRHPRWIGGTRQR